ncbi:MAG TPA: DNA methyltransferase [Candidatus Marinimicrobia bacterium]|nr:DNA methyltransferase [Candidatus Neomarinimicrobiota bacterium]HQE94844.1 DNA methyltransferase [Candidatus Neomarinimicrobiota bacterium]HQK10423.1 DNA methyltransferase [Candidatus Neomarinimicrobiota bacterium]
MKNNQPKFETTTLWDFPTQNYGDTPHGDNKYHGVTPAFVIWNLVQRYTTEGDLIIDPMCGSGTTIDVCKEEKRKVIGFDIVPYRNDIKQADARNLPLDDEIADFIFIDSPYSDNIDYNKHPDNIGNISCEKEEFFIEIEKVAREAHRILKPNKYMAWLIGDHWRKKSGFIPVGFKIYTILEKYFKPIDMIAVSRHNQTSNTPLWHERAKQHNFYLRGFKYLIIMQRMSK